MDQLEKYNVLIYICYHVLHRIKLCLKSINKSSNKIIDPDLTIYQLFIFSQYNSSLFF